MENRYEDFSGRKSLIGNSAEFENDKRLNMGPREEILEMGQIGKTEET